VLPALRYHEEEIWHQGTSCFQSLLSPAVEIAPHVEHWRAKDLHASFVWLLVVAHRLETLPCTHAEVVCLEAMPPDFLQAEVPALLTMILDEMVWVAAGDYPLHLKESKLGSQYGFMLYKSCGTMVI